MNQQSLTASIGLLGVEIDITTIGSDDCSKGSLKTVWYISWKNIRRTSGTMNVWDRPGTIVWKAESAFKAFRADV